MNETASTTASATGLRLGGPGDKTLVAVFTATTFLSALLLFSIQPMFAKMVLPILGGAPSVWAVALCFFQGALLAGYCYAHALNRYVPWRYTGLVHLGLFLFAMIALPIALPAGWREPPPGDAYLWQLGLFSVAVGLPFVAIAANAPLMQAWFARTGHPNGHDPYFLYGASNLGSFFALLAYPLLLEPQFGLTSLSRQWTLGFLLLGFAIAVCFWMLRLSAEARQTSRGGETATQEGEAAAPTWLQRLGWIGLALVPSALLTAYTTHIATDVASAPLIWVGPLSLYLLTFVLVFRERPIVWLPCVLAAIAVGAGMVPWIAGRFGYSTPAWVSTLFGIGFALLFTWAYRSPNRRPVQWLALFHMGAVLIALLQLSQTRHDNFFISSSTGVAAFFLSALVAHRTLYEARPAARHLTEFYLWMSLGGVIGGLIAALVAPKLFSEVLEYPILLALTMACQPGALALSLKDRDELLRLWLIGAGGVLLVWWSRLLDIEDRIWAWSVSIVENLAWLGTGVAQMVAWPLRQVYFYGITAAIALIFAVLALWWRRYPPRQMIAALVMCLAIVVLPSSVKRSTGANSIAERSFFGVYRVSPSFDKQFQVLTHGTTLHGAQRIADNTGALVVDTTPGTYYHPESPMAKTIDVVRERLEKQGKKGRYGVVGLGAGSLACYSKEGEGWRFFEIDPVIVEIASDPTKFSFIYNCQPNLDVVLGDARLTIAKEPDQSYDLIIVDAFSSDAIPVHLLTAEAIRLYAAKLKPDGVVLLHISNRYLDLDSVVSATLDIARGLEGILLIDTEADGSYASTQSTVAVVSADKQVIEEFRKLDMSKELEATTMRGWTDDYSDIMAPFMSRWQGRR